MTAELAQFHNHIYEGNLIEKYQQRSKLLLQNNKDIKQVEAGAPGHLPCEPVSGSYVSELLCNTLSACYSIPLAKLAPF